MSETLSTRFMVTIDPNFKYASWEENQLLSCRVNEVRKQSKGLGSARIELFAKATYQDVSEKYLRNREKVKVGSYVYIFDNTINQGLNTPTIDQAIFVGRISKVFFEKYRDSDDESAQILIDEIGWFLNECIIDNYYLTDGSTSGKVYQDSNYRALSTPPNFNPVLDGRYIANRSENSNTFESNPANWIRSTDDGAWPDTSTRIWTRQQVMKTLRKAATNYGIQLEIDWPSAHQDGELISHFGGKELASYSNYQGQSITKMLDEMIEEPMSYTFIYNKSEGSITLKIYTKSPANVSYLPQVNPITLNLNNYPINTQFTYSELDGAYNAVTVRGERILCCGALTTWEWDNQDTLEKDWSSAEQNAYVDGSDGQTPEVNDPTKADNVRQSLKNVYRRFKFDYENTDSTSLNNKNVIWITDNPGNAQKTEHQRRALCPEFYISEDEEDKAPKYTYEYRTNHSTPNILNVQFSEKLPIYSSKTVYGDDGNISISIDQLPPLLFAPHTDISKNISWGELTSDPTNQAKINFLAEGVLLETGIPAFWDASHTEFAELWENKPKMVSYWDQNAGVTNQYNPYQGVFYPQLTHWGRFILVVAMFSDQRLIYRVKKDDEDLPDREYIIDDPSLQVWFVHAGTPTSIKGDGQLHRTTKDSFARNDLELAREICRNAADWLSQPKNIATLNIPMMNFPIYDYVASASNLEIGNLIESVVDVDGTVTPINTTIESITYSASLQNPEIIVQTNTARMPPWRRLTNLARSAGGRAPRIDSKWDYGEKSSVPTQIDTPKQPSVGGVSTSGVPAKSTETLINIYGYNELEYVNYKGIKHANKPVRPNLRAFSTSAAEQVNRPNCDDLPDGLGIGYDIINGTPVYVGSFIEESYLGVDLIVGDNIRTHTTATLVGQTYTDDEGEEITPVIRYYIPLHKT